MRLFFFIFIFSQLFNFLVLYAEKVKKNSSELNLIKWEKVKENNSNNLKKIIWKSYQGDDIYFKNQDSDDFSNKKIRNNKNKNLTSLLDKNKTLLHGGLTVENALIPKRGTSQLSFNYGSSGSLFSSYKYSLSDFFQLQLISGSLKGVNLESSKNFDLKNTYLNKDNFSYRVGGKVLFLSPQMNDLLWVSSRVTIGRDLDSRQGYFFSDFTSTFKINDKVVLNISPKYLLSGVDNMAALGISNHINLSEKLLFIAETNIGLEENSENNLTFSLRHLQNKNRIMDLYVSNALGIEDLGQLLRSDDYKFGIKISWIF